VLRALIIALLLSIPRRLATLNARSRSRAPAAVMQVDPKPLLPSRERAKEQLKRCQRWRYILTALAALDVILTSSTSFGPYKAGEFWREHGKNYTFSSSILDVLIMVFVRCGLVLLAAVLPRVAYASGAYVAALLVLLVSASSWHLCLP
jgi:hypothetical protein